MGAQFADPTQLTVFDLSANPVRVSRAPISVASVSPRAIGVNGIPGGGAFRLTPRYSARCVLVSEELRMGPALLVPKLLNAARPKNP